MQQRVMHRCEHSAGKRQRCRPWPVPLLSRRPSLSTVSSTVSCVPVHSCRTPGVSRFVSGAFLGVNCDPGRNPAEMQVLVSKLFVRVAPVKLALYLGAVEVVEGEADGHSARKDGLDRRVNGATQLADAHTCVHASTEGGNDVVSGTVRRYAWAVSAHTPGGAAPVGAT